jgi:predicted outer membrane protein
MSRFAKNLAKLAAFGVLSFCLISPIQIKADGTRFLNKAYIDAVTQIYLANLALQQSDNEQVRRLAQMLLDENTKIARAIKEGPCGSEQQTAKEFRHLSGPEFDREYLDATIDRQEIMIHHFKAASTPHRVLPRDAEGRPTARNSPYNVERDSDWNERVAEAYFAKQLLPTLWEDLAAAYLVRAQVKTE